MFYRQYRNVYLMFRFHTIKKILNKYVFIKKRFLIFTYTQYKKKLNIVIKVNQHILKVLLHII